MEESLKAIFDKVNSEDTFARLIGMKLVALQVGFARATLTITSDTVNMYQMAHGGAIWSLADLACEAAGNSLGEPAVALQNSFQFLAAGKAGDVLEATARVVNRSSRVGLIEFEVRNQEGILLTKGQQVIYFRKGGRPQAGGEK